MFEGRFHEDRSVCYLYNTYHGNADQNIAHKVDMLVKGKGVYKYLYDKVSANIATNRNTRSHGIDKVDECDEILELHQRYFLGERYASDGYFTKEMLSASTKARTKDKVMGRDIIDMALNLIFNLKKSMAFGEEKLNGGELPLRMTWDDHYVYMSTLGDKLSEEISRYTD